jgi:hypothetical protein
MLMRIKSILVRMSAFILGRYTPIEIRYVPVNIIIRKEGATFPELGKKLVGLILKAKKEEKTFWVPIKDIPHRNDAEIKEFKESLSEYAWIGFYSDSIEIV